MLSSLAQAGHLLLPLHAVLGSAIVLVYGSDREAVEPVEPRVMRFPAWREGEPDRTEMPNTTVIGEVVKLITVPYAGTEPAAEVIVRPRLSDYVELPVDV